MKKKIFSILLLAATVLSCVGTTSCMTEKTSDSEDGNGSSQNSSPMTDVNGEQSGDVNDDDEVNADCYEVLEAVYNSYSEFPSMKYYSKPATDERAEIKANEFCSFFGMDMNITDEGDILYPDDYSKLDAYAICTPTGALDVQEICVFKFKSGTLEYDMQELCQARITKIKSNYANNANYDTDKSKKAIVDVCAYKIIGRYAVIVCAANPDAAFAIAENTIKAAK